MTAIDWVALTAIGMGVVAVGAILGNVVYLTTWKWPKQDGQVPFARVRRFFKQDRSDRAVVAHLATIKEEKQFCAACGSRKVVWRFQSGFNPKDGQPRHVSYMACPDWDEVSWTANYHRSVTSGLPFAYRPEVPPRDCENKVTTSMAAMMVHLGHADGDVSVNCKRCIIDMERAGIITHDDADARLKEIA